MQKGRLLRKIGLGITFIFRSFGLQSGIISREGQSASISALSMKKVSLTSTWPEKWPYKPTDFSRQDASKDTLFYNQPRLVYHIDEEAVSSLTNYYRSVIPSGSSILDICSSWVSHLPSEIPYQRVAGLGMNSLELQQNKQLTEFAVADLNLEPNFPYGNNEFDVVNCVVSVDYLIHPVEVFKEIYRVLRPGGRAIISQSNRCFPTKAINIWLNTGDLGHLNIIASYFHYAGGFENIEGFDISPYPGRSDPMYIVQAKKA